jgi:hypothetical protein
MPTDHSLQVIASRSQLQITAYRSRLIDRILQITVYITSHDHRTDHRL